MAVSEEVAAKAASSSHQGGDGGPEFLGSRDRWDKGRDIRRTADVEEGSDQTHDHEVAGLHDAPAFPVVPEGPAVVHKVAVHQGHRE